jgi:hypothetical protein
MRPMISNSPLAATATRLAAVRAGVAAAAAQGNRANSAGGTG